MRAWRCFNGNARLRWVYCDGIISMRQGRDNRSVTALPRSCVRRERLAIRRWRKHSHNAIRLKNTAPLPVTQFVFNVTRLG
jgi:hypothetical protein